MPYKYWIPVNFCVISTRNKHKNQFNGKFQEPFEQPSYRIQCITLLTRNHWKITESLDCFYVLVSLTKKVFLEI